MIDHHSCSGCSVCLLVCPVWRETRDVRATPKGRAKALQAGAHSEARAAAAACTLCGACEPACPESLPVIDMMIAARRAAGIPALPARRGNKATRILLAGRVLGRDAERRARTLALLGRGYSLGEDDGNDIAQALESGEDVSRARLESFVASLQGAREIVAAEGILLRPLRAWLPAVEVASLGYALTTAVSGRLRRGDLYVIESRAFNGDHARLVRHYDGLRAATGCDMNLDLLRIAIPAQGSEAQARWILEGRAVDRIIVEDLGDRQAFAFAGKPVLHLADLP